MKSSEVENTAAEWIAQLKSEMETRRAEVTRLECGILPGRADAPGGVESNGDEANWLGDLIHSWERRFAKTRIARRTTSPNEAAPDSFDAPPASVCTTSSLARDVPGESVRRFGSGRGIDATLPSEASEPTNASMDEPDEALEAKCARLKNVIAHLQDRSSDQENAIELLKAEGVKLLAINRIIEREMSAELERLDAAQRRIATLEARSSSLEDTVERLRAENLRLRVRSRNLEEEKGAIEEEMETIKNGVQAFYIERSRYEIM